MSSHTAREPEKVRAYFAKRISPSWGPASAGATTRSPRSCPATLATPAWRRRSSRRMRADGVTAVALSRAGHVADFQIGEGDPVKRQP